ncbi:MAG: HAD family hydrolase [Chloroflexota bacterium]
MKKPFELVIFDCDGVLVDSEPITNRIFAEMLSELGVQLTTAVMRELFIGRSLAQCLQQVETLLGEPIPTTFVPTLRQRAGAVLLAELQAIEGIHAALDAIHLPICVASSGDREKMQLTLGKTGLLSRFSPNNIFSADDVAHAKPAPDLFLLAAQQNGVAPAACAVIEDSPSGVRAGVAAGMTVFGFAAHTPASELRREGAHLIFSEMAQLPNLLTSSHNTING